tara:strand:+ start:111 stop:293 length:183 start_codon:yes stop_codon:yes gene_type:complete
MELILNQLRSIFQSRTNSNKEAHEAAIKLEKESTNLNSKVESYLYNAKKSEESWKKKWLK